MPLINYSSAQPIQKTASSQTVQNSPSSNDSDGDSIKQECDNGNYIASALVEKVHAPTPLWRRCQNILRMNWEIGNHVRKRSIVAQPYRWLMHNSVLTLASSNEPEGLVAEVCSDGWKRAPSEQEGSDPRLGGKCDPFLAVWNSSTTITQTVKRGREGSSRTKVELLLGEDVKYRWE